MSTSTPASVPSARRSDPYLPIGDYAVIGDSRTLALVARDGSIDWMCAPSLDSPAVFAALLDPARGGRFVLAPGIAFESERRYVPGTNVLETEFRTAEGTVRVTDAFTVDDAQNAPWRELVRRVECLSGSVPMRLLVEVRFDFDTQPEPPAAIAGGHVFRHGSLQLGVRTFGLAEPELSGFDLHAGFTLQSGESADVVLVACADGALPMPGRDAVERRLKSTLSLWHAWTGRLDYDGPWRAAVERSLLALRLLADGRTGAIAAAGTTSLPEVVGGSRNYDYRFAWVRDLSFTVDALLRVGVQELSHASVTWLLGAVARTAPRVDPVYALDGTVIRSQHAIDLAGWRDTRPVHLGNQAGSQLQLGGFGDLIETVYRYAECGHVLSPAMGERLADTVDLLCTIWQNADSGLWELGDTAQYTTSKIGCWSAVQRLLDLVEHNQAPARHLERWRTERDRIRGFIETRLWSESRRSYLMKEGSDALDCGVLLAARRGFTDPRGERMQGTIDAILGELRAGDAVFYRYSGMEEEENCFIACSFWMVEALALAGRLDEAAEMMDGAVALANDVGLLSEEVRASDHALRGNLPQALSHLALISAAAFLARAEQGE